jgi:FKBP-type peptidyl-prolyl cis-trans isomerase SlpA
MSKVESGNTVKVHYTGTFENGEVFDSSVERNEPIGFTVGSNQVILGFESAVIGMSVGESKTITLQPEEAYGPINEENIQEIPKEMVPEGVQSGQMLTAETPEGPVNVIVKEVRENTVILDGNHPFSGKVLNFEIEVVEIN